MFVSTDRAHARQDIKPIVDSLMQPLKWSAHKRSFYMLRNFFTYKTNEVGREILSYISNIKLMFTELYL